MSLLRPLKITLGAFGTVSGNGTPLDMDVFECPGRKICNKEADYPFEIAFDDDEWLPWDLAMNGEVEPGDVGFKKIRVRNLGPGQSSLVFLVGSMRVTDGRLAISENRNGAAASYTPPNAIETVTTEGVGGFAVGSWKMLLPYDANRELVKLTTDAVTASYYGFVGGAEILNPARNLVARTGEGRWTELRTKAAIWVRHTEAGKTITAHTFGY